MILTEFLQRFDGVKRQGQEYLARCPAHKDKKQSLSIGCPSGKIVLKCHAGCQTESILSILSLSFKDLSPEKPMKSDKSEIIATYDYTDEKGKLIFQTVRFYPKNFNQRHPCPKSKDEWTWNLGGNKEKCNCKKIAPLFITA